MASGAPRRRIACRASATRATSTSSARAATRSLVDFGDGDVLDQLDELGVERVTDVLLTHHHRDQLGGLRRAVDAGHPHLGAAGRAGADRRRRRALAARGRSTNDYDLREDRFSLLEPVPVAGTVAEYRTRRFGGVRRLRRCRRRGTRSARSPTSSSSTGGGSPSPATSSTATGKVWSLAATQWSYSGRRGLAATIVSLRRPRAIASPTCCCRRTASRSTEPAAALAHARASGSSELARPAPPRAAGTSTSWLRAAVRRGHAAPAAQPRRCFATQLRARSRRRARRCSSTSATTSDRRRPSTERAARRPLLWSLDGAAPRPRRRAHRGRDRRRTTTTTTSPALNLLRDVEGAEVWAPANVAPILEQPDALRPAVPLVRPDPGRPRAPARRAVPLARVRAHGAPAARAHALRGGDRVRGRRHARPRAPATSSRTTAAAAILNYQYRNRFRDRRLRARAPSSTARLRPDLHRSAATGCRAR